MRYVVPESQKSLAEVVAERARRQTYPWRQAEPYRHTRADHMRDVRLILGAFAAGLLAAHFLLFLYLVGG